jgi:hypothetical protein
MMQWKGREKMERTADVLKERRLERMRLGQSVGDVIPLLSDDEFRVALVPLTEAEYQQCMEKTAALPMGDSIMESQVKDRHIQREILTVSIREPNNLAQRMFESTIELGESLEVQDLNFIWDSYLEMVDRSAPSIDGLTNDEIEAIKKVLVETDWSELSGRAWYAAKRFLSAVGQELPPVNSLGSGSTSNLTTTNDLGKSTTDADLNSSEKLARSAESQ